MQFHPNELWIIYDPNTNTAKQTKAYALTITDNIFELDVTKDRLTTTLWKEIINMLDMKPWDIMNQDHVDFKKIGDNSFTMQGWLDILLNSPSIVKAPIAISNKRAVLCTKPTDILKLPLKRAFRHNKT